MPKFLLTVIVALSLFAIPQPSQAAHRGPARSAVRAVGKVVRGVFHRKPLRKLLKRGLSFGGCR